MVILDLRGEICPFNFLRAKLALEKVALGDTLEVLFDSEAARQSLPRSLRQEGHEVSAVEPQLAGYRLVVYKRSEHPLHQSGHD